MYAEGGCDPTKLMDGLMRGGRYLEARLDAALADLGLSAAKWGALKHLLEAEEALPLGQLAGRLACVKSNATQLVDRLEADGLVRRVPDSEDRRSIRAEVTAEGRLRYEAGLERMREVERELLGDYTLEERLLLARLLQSLERGGL
ncbi:MAG: MarR family winged helix-turn-helix transcriptional regulator [Chloroflexia bacterium]